MIRINHIAGLLLVLLFINISSPVWIKAYFDAHRAEITAAYCVNKDKPELKCNGQCHLTKMLTASESNSEDAPVMVYSFSNEYFQEVTCLDVFSEFADNAKHGGSLTLLNPRLPDFSIFHPPIG